jgi:undecaprenyl-diphosphatase
VALLVVALLALAATVVPGLWTSPPPLAASTAPHSLHPSRSPSATSDTEMTPVKAAVLGLVEGVTEYLPVSSTGHLLVAQRAMGIGDTDATEDAADSYAIAIQAGAILAVLVLYRARIATLVAGLAGRHDDGRTVLVGLVLAVVPAVVVGLAFEDVIKERLLGPWPVVAAWAVGGVVVLTLGVRLERSTGGIELEAISSRQALLIGAAQCLAMWPGTSRSLVTILAALAVGLSLRAAVEFAFLLGLAVLGGATLYETAGNGQAMIDAYGVVDPLIGLAVAFGSALAAVAWMVGYLQRRSLAVFGWYRLGVAALVAGLLTTDVL